MNTSYRIDVIGTAWQGFQGSYSKPFKTIPDPLTYQWLKGEFGDFQELEGYRVTKLEYGFVRDGNKSVSTHTEEIIRDWHNEDCAHAFEEMNR